VAHPCHTHTHTSSLHHAILIIKGRFNYSAYADWRITSSSATFWWWRSKFVIDNYRSEGCRASDDDEPLSIESHTMTSNKNGYGCTQPFENFNKLMNASWIVFVRATTTPSKTARVRLFGNVHDAYDHSSSTSRMWWARLYIHNLLYSAIIIMCWMEMAYHRFKRSSHEPSASSYADASDIRSPREECLQHALSLRLPEAWILLPRFLDMDTPNMLTEHLTCSPGGANAILAITTSMPVTRCKRMFADGLVVVCQMFEYISYICTTLERYIHYINGAMTGRRDLLFLYVHIEKRAFILRVPPYCESTMKITWAEHTNLDFWW
jgi:hypothetical protein